LTRLALEVGAGRLAEEARALLARVRDGLFYVACVGQFKRGKSSLINALLGDAILPAGVAPVTTVITVVRHGPDRSARVRFAAGDWQDIPLDDLALYVTEEQNPENAKAATAVEVFLPSELLATGMCLVDTPGIGSVFAGNTEATRAFVPHVDAALVVLGADPPISADELSLVEEISRQCRDLLFVMNKADKLADADRQEAADFTRRVLAERAGKPQVPLFEVSALERQNGPGPARDWPALVRALEALARQSGSELVQAAEERGLALLAGRLGHHLDEDLGALLRPLDESERRVESLRAFVAEAERSLGDLGYLFTAEQERLGRIFFERMEAFLTGAKPEARRELSGALRAVPGLRGPALRRRAIDQAEEISTRRLDAWLAEAQPAAEALYVEATTRFVDLANSFLERLVASGEPAVAGLPRTVSPEAGFRVRSRLHYVSLTPLTTRTPLGAMVDLLRSREQQLRVLEREIGEYLETLLFANANRIANDFDDRVLESRRRFQFEIQSYLTEMAATAEQALARARERRAQGSLAVQGEIDRIRALKDRLAALGPEGKGGD